MPHRDAWKDFDFDFLTIERIPVNFGFCPPFEEVVLEENEHTRVIRDVYGVTFRQFKDQFEQGPASSMPQFIAHPLKDAEDWEKLKERLDPHDPARFPDNWHELVQKYRNREFPLQLGCFPYGFFGTLRDFMGLQNLLLAFFDQPELIRDILDYLTDLWIEIWAKVVSRVDADVAHFWEDMCYRGGPLISPELFRHFMLPCYKRMTAFARDNGIDIITVDTDGNCWELIPLFLEGGVTGMWPFEVRAGMDIVEVRRRFPTLQICGGINLSALSAGKEAMDEELNKIALMLPTGGYIPFFDNDLLHDIPWENYRYFVTRQREILQSA
ncbi:MAG: uroporphyrinogen decarboxylase family protein [Planctomycetota bacterium]